MAPARSPDEPVEWVERSENPSSLSEPSRAVCRVARPIRRMNAERYHAMKRRMRPLRPSTVVPRDLTASHGTSATSHDAARSSRRGNHGRVASEHFRTNTAILIGKAADLPEPHPELGATFTVIQVGAAESTPPTGGPRSAGIGAPG